MSDEEEETTQPRRAGGDDDESVLPPAFVNKLLKVLSDTECANTLQYGQDGTTLVVPDSSLFATKVIPRFFKHSNFASFVRQLNLYGFHKTTQDPDVCEFAHKYFRRDRPDLLKHIKRKISAEKPDPAKSKTDFDDIVAVVNEMKAQQARMEGSLMKKEMEKQMIYQEVSVAQQRHRSIEEKVTKLSVVLMKACGVLAQLAGAGGNGGGNGGGAGSAKRPRLTNGQTPESERRGPDPAEIEEWIQQLASIGSGGPSSTGSEGLAKANPQAMRALQSMGGGMGGGGAWGQGAGSGSGGAGLQFEAGMSLQRGDFGMQSGMQGGLNDLANFGSRTLVGAGDMASFSGRNQALYGGMNLAAASSQQQQQQQQLQQQQQNQQHQQQQQQQQQLQQHQQQLQHQLHQQQQLQQSMSHGTALSAGVAPAGVGGVGLGSIRDDFGASQLGSTGTLSSVLASMNSVGGMGMVGGMQHMMNLKAMGGPSHDAPDHRGPYMGFGWIP